MCPGVLLRGLAELLAEDSRTRLRASQADYFELFSFHSYQSLKGMYVVVQSA